MMPNSEKMPFYAKNAFIFICLFALVFTLKVAQDIILPLVFAVIVAIVLNPIVNFMVRKKINRILAITMAVTLAVAVIFGILCVIFAQISMFRETYPQLKEKFNLINQQFMEWLSDKLNMKEAKVVTWVQENKESAMDGIAYGKILSETVRILFEALLIPIYVLMILYYKPLLLEFFRRLFKAEHHQTVTDVLTNSKKIIQSYLVGLIFEFLIVATMNSVGLLLLDIDYAIILGISGALLNIIPYLGGLIAIALPMTMALVTKDSSSYPLLVLCLYVFTQFVDNNYIIPRIVASRVQINALVSIIVVLIGSAIWGIPGMFLSIPITAIIKVIFDHIDPLKPWGYLLGNTLPVRAKSLFKKRTPKPA